MYHHFSLIVSGLEDTPRGTILHRAIMPAYAFHDLWPSAAAIFSFLTWLWHKPLSCFFFPFSSSMSELPMSGLTSPGQAGGLQEERRSAG